MPFAAILTTIVALPLSSLAVTGYAFRYSGYAHASHRRQGPCSVLLAYKTTFAAILTAYKVSP